MQIGGHRCIEVIQKNKFSVGETVNLMRPDGSDEEFIVEEIFDENGRQIMSAPHPQQKLYVRTDADAERYDVLRRKEAAPQA